MPSILFNQYGKTKIRLTQVLRTGGKHEVVELSVNILFQGDFVASYTQADNGIVLPTDTMKNTVYALARWKPIHSIEEFARDLATHFLGRVERLMEIQVTIEQRPWARISGHGSAFLLGGNDQRITKLVASRNGESVTSGIRGLEILKTADSAFAGFAKDELTTLPETHDRLLGTVLDAEWTYRSLDIDFNAEHSRIRSVLLDCFADHVSKSVQHTLYDMAVAALGKGDILTEMHLVMPNKHRLLVDLLKFGLDNPNQIFVPTDEPSGYIEARVSADHL